MDYKSLSQEQIQHFLDYGFIHLEGCFDPEFAKKSTSAAFDRLGYREDDPATWEQPIVHMPADSYVDVKEFAPKAYDAICDLLGGEDRVKTPVRWGDGYIVNFKLGADRDWMAPSPEAGGWHKDGDFFWHFLDSPEQGLLVIVVWRDIAPKGGGTFLACDSVKPIAEYLNENRQGLHPFEGGFGNFITECTDFREVTAKVGDVIVMHPYMLHASSQNHSGKARFITNPPVALKEPMNFNRDDPADYSPVELAVLNALGVDRLDYQLEGERRRFDAKAYREARAREAKAREGTT
ncbi:MAG: phytanoyl-CoA dioxygenase family protein [Anaerolineae bacterium]|nr:phytanoyl-CoA dioxygenase family protein [Anaerolineae bacterium]